MPVKEKSAGIIVFRRKNVEFLFLKRREGWLDLPKGHVEEGESEIEAARRETYEESGLKPDVIQGFRESHQYSYRTGKYVIEKTVVYFLGEVAEDVHVKISEEHSGYVWLDINSLEKRLSFQNQVDILMKAYAFITGAGK